MTATLPPAVKRFATAALQLAASIAEAEEVQWKPSLAPKPREDTTERARGGHGDPTLSTVVDERRLAVRAAVTAAYAKFDEATAALLAARAEVEAAVDAWNGS